MRMLWSLGFNRSVIILERLMCVCVCVRERERHSDRERERYMGYSKTRSHRAHFLNC